MTSPVVLGLFAVLVIGAAVSAFRLVIRPDDSTYLGGRSSDAAHLLMNASMAAMLVVPAAALPSTAVLVIYVAIAVVLAGLVALGLIRPTPARRLHRPAHLYHVIAALAMAWAVHLMPAGMSDMSGMDGSAHHHAAASTPVEAWVLVGLFTLDALGTLALLRRVNDRVAVLPHVIMDVGMIAMLLPGWMTAVG